MLSKFIQQLRKKHHLTQEFLASRLGISRPTYLQIERGDRELTISEVKKLATIFNLSFHDFLNEEEDPLFLVKIEKTKKQERAKQEKIRISVPQEKANKFKQVLLYVLSKVSGKPNMGQTVLYKLLYFIDFDYYEKHEEQLMGAKYIKNIYGPTPIMFAKILEQLESEEKIETVKSKFYQYEQTKYQINPSNILDVSALSSREVAYIDWEIERLGNMTASQISELSHMDTPWQAAQEKEMLEYEHVFYRSNLTSVRQYEPL